MLSATEYQKLTHFHGAVSDCSTCCGDGTAGLKAPLRCQETQTSNNLNTSDYALCAVLIIRSYNCNSRNDQYCAVPGGIHAVINVLLHVFPLQRLPAAQERHPALVDLVSACLLGNAPACVVSAFASTPLGTVNDK